MNYKRHESFRFTFGEPISGFFKIAQKSDSTFTERKGALLINDISPKGLRFSSALDLPIHEIGLQVSFTLNDHLFEIPGRLVWKRPFKQQWVYGFSSQLTEQEMDLVIHHLKLFTRTKRTNPQS